MPNLNTEINTSLPPTPQVSHSRSPIVLIGGILLVILIIIFVVVLIMSAGSNVNSKSSSANNVPVTTTTQAPAPIDITGKPDPTVSTSNSKLIDQETQDSSDLQALDNSLNKLDQQSQNIDSGISITPASLDY